MYVALLRQLMACKRTIIVKICQHIEVCKSKLRLSRKKEHNSSKNAYEALYQFQCFGKLVSDKIE